MRPLTPLAVWLGIVGAYAVVESVVTNRPAHFGMGAVALSWAIAWHLHCRREAHKTPLAAKLRGEVSPEDRMPDDIRRAIEAKNAAQLAITREAAAPPVGRNHVAHVECQLAGHMWGQTPLGYMRCTRCGGHGLRTGSVTGDRIYLDGGAIQTVNPAVDRHEAFPEDAAWERKIRDLDNRIYRATGIRMGYIGSGSIEGGRIQ